MTKDIDYIIKTHNELPYLKMYLKSLKEGSCAMWEMSNIKVFANRCTDGTKEWCDNNDIWCEEVDLPGLYSIWNYGAEITDCNLLVFSASDFVLAPNFWNNIIIAASCNPEFNHITGTCLDNGISYQHEDVEKRRWYKRDCGDNWKDFDHDRFLNASQSLATEKTITPSETSYCPFLTSREHYNTLDGFNTELGDYPTNIDHDFLMRGKEAGGDCCVVNNSFFYHFGKKSLLRRDGIDLTYKLEDIESL